MTISISLYLDNINIHIENPGNYRSLICRTDKGDDVTFYCSHEQWLALRVALKRAPDYCAYHDGIRLPDDEAEIFIQKTYTVLA
jgi:hypothetical protein